MYAFGVCVIRTADAFNLGYHWQQKLATVTALKCWNLQPLYVRLISLRVIIVTFILLYKYYILYGMTWSIGTPRKHCRPRRSRGRQWFPRGDDLPCHPVKNVIFILLCGMSQFPSQLKVCVMKKVCASGNILLECYPLLRRFSECGRDVRHWFLDLNRVRIFFTQSTFFWMLPSSIYPL